MSGCPYGDGSPCEIDGDCASAHCCGATSRIRGVCRPAGEACAIAFDAGNEDARAEDTGTSDAPLDGGSDAGSDGGPDAPSSPDAPLDAPVDAGADAPAALDAPELDVPADA
jgi:hypothetical protein